jgi:hypothetical protein
LYQLVAAALMLTLDHAVKGFLIDLFVRSLA